MDNEDHQDRLRELEKEVEKLRKRSHVAPGIKGWLIFHSIQNVVVLAALVLLTVVSVTTLPYGERNPAGVYFVLIFIYFFYYTVIFFQHKKSVPTHARGMCALTFVFNLLYVITNGFGSYIREEQIIIRLIGAAIMVIWFVYFGVSERVKVTFVK